MTAYKDALTLAGGKVDFFFSEATLKSDCSFREIDAKLVMSLGSFEVVLSFCLAGQCRNLV